MKVGAEESIVVLISLPSKHKRSRPRRREQRSAMMVVICAKLLRLGVGSRAELSLTCKGVFVLALLVVRGNA